MEHSALHVLQLTGLIIALGGAFLMVALLAPALHTLGSDAAREDLARRLSVTVARWMRYGALAAALGTLADLFVQVAEVQGRAVFGGVDLALVVRFVTRTTVGHLSLARAGLLFLVAVATRLPGSGKWWVAGGLGLGAAVCTALVSHAAAQPGGRVLAIGSQIIHIGAAALWVGVLIHLLAARASIENLSAQSCVALLAEIVRRFSPLALTAVALMTVSGAFAAVRYLASPGAVLTSAYGLTLCVKLLLLTPALFAGYVNYRIIRPALRPALLNLRSGLPTSTFDAAQLTPVLQRFGRMLELEVTAGLLVITVAGIVGSISPPGEDGALRLTPVQVHALLSSDLPSTEFVDPNSFVGSTGDRPLADMRYSEFTHNWSGVFVGLLGLCWLLQSWGGRPGALAGRAWPLLLVPFAGFIAVFADPDVWLVPVNTFRSAISDPVIVEHQLGALMVLIMVWLGWRDRRRPAAVRPLGYALPAIMIVGSVLLLGHAHASLRASDELTNLINVEHAVLGALGLTAGATRWLGLRGLLPRRAAAVVWPALVIAVGVFMAFFYREVI